MEKYFCISDLFGLATSYYHTHKHKKAVCILIDFMAHKNPALCEHPLIQHGCRAYLLAQYPELVGIANSSITPKNYNKWLELQVSRFDGGIISVRPIPEGWAEHWISVR